MTDLKTGKTYGAGVAKAEAKKIVVKECTTIRNPKGTLVKN